MNGVWTLIAAVLSFIIAASLGKVLIPFLHKLKYGQTILEIGPSWHKNKQGTPTMGGIMFIISIFFTVLVCVPLYYIVSGGSILNMTETPLMTTKIFAGLLMAVGFGLIGFFDDYIKVVKKRNLGLTSVQKLLLQFLVAAAYLASLYMVEVSQGGTHATITIVPFVGNVDLGYFYWILAALLIVGMVNAVNFTDGIDGLNASVTFFASIFFMIISSLVGMLGLSIMAAALSGGCLGFLIWNFNPAKVFMGDTGSLFLGGMVCALAFGLDMPILLLPMGIVYICEICSVVLQVLYFKATKGKRLFKMSPIHHHFEMCGWSEVKICTVFGIVSAIGGIISVVLVMFGI